MMIDNTSLLGNHPVIFILFEKKKALSKDWKKNHRHVPNEQRIHVMCENNRTCSACKHKPAKDDTETENHSLTIILLLYYYKEIVKQASRGWNIFEKYEQYSIGHIQSTNY